MPVTPDDLAALEERLLAKLQGQSSRVEEEEELPAAAYARNFYVTAALLFYVCASMLASSVTTGVYGNLSQIEYLLFPLCWTFIAGLVFGTLDSPAAGRRAMQLLRCWLYGLIICIPILHWTSGMYADAILYLLTFAIVAFYWPFLLGASREIICLRYRGSLTKQARHYTMRALKIAGFQIVLAVSAISQGIDGKETYFRVYATFMFSTVLIQAWVFLIGVFDVGGVDASDAAKLRLSPLQAAAIASCGAVTMTGLSAYVLAEQRQVDRRAAKWNMYMLVISNYFCMTFVGRLVWVARRAGVDSSTASVQPVKDEVEGGGVFDVPGA